MGSKNWVLIFQITKFGQPIFVLEKLWHSIFSKQQFLRCCKLNFLGKQKKTLSGFSSSAILPHSGFIFFHPLVQTLPPDIRNKVARTIANKCTLAARVDSLHESPDGEIGRGLMDQISQKIEKMLEPPPTKSTKALPKPLDKASKKRGGRRARKFKESMGMSDFRRKANRMNFGELQEDVMQTDIGFTLGQLKSDSLKGGGRLRAGVVDNKTRAKYVYGVFQKPQKFVTQTF